MVIFLTSGGNLYLFTLLQSLLLRMPLLMLSLLPYRRPALKSVNSVSDIPGLVTAASLVEKLGCKAIFDNDRKPDLVFRGRSRADYH